MARHIRLTGLLLAAVIGAVGAVSAGAAAQASPVGRLTHAQAVVQLRAAGISWSASGGCTDRNNPTCTSFEGVRRSSISGVRRLRAASGCRVNVTGGTEAGHAAGVYSHGTGYALDISKGRCVGAYIRRSFAYVGYVPGWGHQYRAPSGNLYTDEGDHWDIVFYTCGGCAGGGRRSAAGVAG